MEIQKPHLSVSAMGMLARCGEQYRRRYIEGDKLPPGIAALVGRGVDQTVTANLQAVIDGLQLLPVEQLADLARDAVNNEFSAGEVALTEEEAANPKAAKGSAVDKAIRLSWLHGESVAPRLKPVSVQRKWRLGIENFPFDLLGFIDVEEKERLRDTKTSGKTPPVGRCAHLRPAHHVRVRQAADRRRGPAVGPLGLPGGQQEGRAQECHARQQARGCRLLCLAPQG